MQAEEKACHVCMWVYRHMPCERHSSPMQTDTYSSQPAPCGTVFEGRVCVLTCHKDGISWVLCRGCQDIVTYRLSNTLQYVVSEAHRQAYQP